MASDVICDAQLSRNKEQIWSHAIESVAVRPAVKSQTLLFECQMKTQASL